MYFSPINFYSQLGHQALLKKILKAGERTQLHEEQRVISNVAFTFASIYQCHNSYLCSYSITIMQKAFIHISHKKTDDKFLLEGSNLQLF